MKPYFFILCTLACLITSVCNQAKKPDSKHNIDTNIGENEMPEVTDIIIPLSKDLDLKEDTFLIYYARL